MGEKRLLEIRGAEAAPPSVAIEVGVTLDPLSLGTEGTWRIVGPRVLAVHGYLYFDGRALYVQSADPNEPLTVNRRRVTTAWTEVPIPSAIEVGGVDILYQSDEAFEEGDPTIAAPVESMRDLQRFSLEPPTIGPSAGEPDTILAIGKSRHPLAPPAAGAGAGGPSAGAGVSSGALSSSSGSLPASLGTSRSGPVAISSVPDSTLLSSSGSMRGALRAGTPPDEESTLFQPLDATGSHKIPSINTGSNPALSSTNPFAGIQLGGTPPALRTPEGAPPPATENLWHRFRREWASFSMVKRVALVLFPFALLFSLDVILEPQEEAVATKTKPIPVVPSASASAIASTRPASSAHVDPVPSASVGESLDTVPTATGPTTSASADLAAKPVLLEGKRTIERQAADAFQSGNFKKAADLYAQLSADHPENRAFSEAARIARTSASERGK